MNTIKNRVQLIGNLGNDPDITVLNSGKKVAKLSIATHDVYRNQAGERIEETIWHQVIAWDRKADLVEKYCRKGSEVVVVGKVVSRTFNDKAGIKRYVTEIVANEVMLIGVKH